MSTFVFFAMLNSNSFLQEKSDYSVISPDKKISVRFNISDDKKAFYNVKYDDVLILQDSQLGIIREDEDFSKNLSLESASDIKAVRSNYEMLHGKKRFCSYTGNSRIFHLKNASGKKMDVVFQVSNDGVAFRYYFPEKSDVLKKITKEISSFRFNPGTKAYIQPMSEAKSGWCQANPSYEEYYQQSVEIEKLRFNNAGWVFPTLFQFKDYWMLITETAPDRNYCGCRLQQDSDNKVFFIGFPQKPEVFPGGLLNPESPLPWYTPWRIIAIGDNLKTIAESTLGTDLANPSKSKKTSFIKPGKSSWSWALLKDNATVYDVQKKFIDFASDMNWQYCLIDAFWDKQIGYDKIKELAYYAAKKNVGLLLWYNSAGSWNTTPQTPKNKLLTHEDRVKEFKRLKEMGIKGIKVDFFGGDGQSMMSYYQDIFEDASKFNLLVNCHGATLPRGWHRTYPNLVTMEGIKGFEYVTFEQINADLQPNHCCMLPFTRNVFDPMDFTPVCFSEMPNIKRVTTNGFELALSVIFTSGIQHYVEIPEGMAKVPDYVKDFLREVPSCWEDTRLIDGFPGKLVVIARRAKNTWYIAGINGENIEKNIEVKIPFIQGTRRGILITDGEDNRSFKKQNIILEENKPFKIDLKENGGFVIKVL